MSFIYMHFKRRYSCMFQTLSGVPGCTDNVRVCVHLHVSLCIRDFPCRLSNMCCHWETHWEDLLNLALTPETPTSTVLSPALCRTPLKPRRLNNEKHSGLPLQPARLNWEENQNQFLSFFKKELGENRSKNIKQNISDFFFCKIQSETHAKWCNRVSLYANPFFMFCVYSSFVASGFALAVVCYLPSDVMMLKTAVKVC